MHMEIDRKELKQQAREAISAARPHFALVALVYLLMTTGLGYLPSLLPFPADTPWGISTAALFAFLLAVLLNQVLDFGLDLWSLWTNRRLEPGVGALFQGFSVVGRLLLMKLMILLRLLGWAILLSVLSTTAVLVFPFAAALLIPALYVILTLLMLQYALAPYLLADHPDDGPSAAIRRSVELTRGWKWELFKLDLSFLGWFLLAALLSFGVLLLFLRQAGLFQALAAVPLEELPELISGYSLWRNGLLLGGYSFSEHQIALYTLYDSVAGSLKTLLCSDLLSLPLLLWLTPYYAAAKAAFYDARLRLQRESAPLL